MVAGKGLTILLTGVAIVTLSLVKKISPHLMPPTNMCLQTKTLKMCVCGGGEAGEMA